MHQNARRLESLIAITKQVFCQRRLICQDIIELLNRYMELPQGNFHAFIKSCWRAREFVRLHFICVAEDRERKELYPRLWDEYCFNLLKFFAIDGYEERWLIGCLFTLYSLYQTQPDQQKRPIRMTATIADKLVEFAERLTNYPNGNPARMDALHCMNQLFQDPSITGSPAAIQIIAFDQYLSELCYYLQHFDTIGQFPDRNSICKQELMRLSERNVQRALPQIKRLDLEISKLLLEYREAIADDQLGCFASTDGFIQREAMEGVLLNLEQLLANSKRELELIECRREEMEIQVAPTAAVEPPLVRGSMPELIFHSSQTTEETAAEGQLIAEDELQYFDNFDDDDSSLSINISQPPSPSLPFSTPHNPLPLDEMIATATENDVLYDIDESEDWAYRGGLL